MISGGCQEVHVERGPRSTGVKCMLDPWHLFTFIISFQATPLLLHRRRSNSGASTASHANRSTSRRRSPWRRSTTRSTPGSRRTSTATTSRSANVFSRRRHRTNHERHGTIRRTRSRFPLFPCQLISVFHSFPVVSQFRFPWLMC